MKSPFATTLIMAVLALIGSAIAAAFYPWPETAVVNAIVGKPLFESYDTNSVRSIKITKYNDERSELERMVLRRSGEKWTIPEHKQFVATNPAQIATAANSLIDRVVLDETTDEQQAYFEFGVVDPAEYQNTPNRSGLGTKIVLENRNGQEIASLIVGKRLKDDPKQLKHFVRVPGQPNVYVIDFNPLALNTDFKNWVNPNLFQLEMNLPVKQIEIESYRIDPSKIGSSSRQLNYRTALAVGQSGLQLISIEGAGEKGAWSKVSMTQEISNQLQVVARQLTNIQFSDVLKKTAELAKLFKDPNPDANDSLLSSLKPLGFVKTGFENSSYQFDSVGGEVTVETEDGVFVTLNIGTIADKAKGGDELQLSYYAMVTAGVNEAILPEPKEAAIAADADETEKADQKKAYLRLVKERDDKIQAAKVRASEINQRNADWVYVVSEDVIEGIRPDVNLGSAKKIGDALRVSPKAEPKTEQKEEPAKEEPANDDEKK